MSVVTLNKSGLSKFDGRFNRAELESIIASGDAKALESYRADRVADAKGMELLAEKVGGLATVAGAYARRAILADKSKLGKDVAEALGVSAPRVTHLGYAESLLFGLAEPFAGTADDADFLRAFAGMKAHAELRKFVAEALKLPAVTLTRGDVLDSLEMIESAKAKAEADKRAARPNNGTSADVGGSASTDTQSGTDTGSAPVGELKPVSMADEIRSARALVRGLAVDSVNTDALAELQKLAEAVAAKLAECAAAGNESDAPIADPADAS